MIPVKILSVRYLNGVSPELCGQLGIAHEQRSMCLVTTDCDDATYIALDEATKAACVTVSYARSFYAGAKNASTPYAGEVLGILSGADPAAVRSGAEAMLRCLHQVGFTQAQGVSYLAHTVSRTGTFLSKEAGIAEGTPLAYLIAPPLESMYAMEYALKAADVRLCRLYAPPTQTNFGGGLLTGTSDACQAACQAFAEAVCDVARRPVDFPPFQIV